MRLIIETEQDREHVDSHLAQIRAALPMDLWVLDGGLSVLFRTRPASGPSRAQPGPLPPAGGPQGT